MFNILNMEKYQIVPAEIEDLPVILEIYEHARQFMRKTGNLTQWLGGFPPAELLLSDIEKQQLYVLRDGDEIYGVFALIMGEDPTYGYIEDGQWLSSEPYGTLHRVASAGKVHGFLSMAVAFSWKKIPHLRIDTHKDNHVMQKAIQKAGFQRCGIIYLLDGNPRIAYEKLQSDSPQ